MNKNIFFEIKEKNFFLFFICLVLSIIGHGFFIYNRITMGTTMVCAYDELSQMLTFKSYLYSQFKAGNFFFDFNGNISGDFFNRLSYYYSTSIFFYVTCILTYILEFFNLIKNPSYLYWGETIMIISIIRSALIIYASSIFFMYLGCRKKVAVFAASLYAISIINFVHASCWEFFSDALLWLPIILFGVEKIIRKEGCKTYVLGLTLTLINNAYFAYINIFLTVFYVLIRWIFRINTKELPIHKQFIKYVGYGILSFLISLPAFSAFYFGFSSTIRPDAQNVNNQFFFLDLKEFSSMFFNSQVCIIPVIFIILLFTFRIHRSRKSVFAIVISVLFIILNYNYFLGSLFNGFSAVQFRWNYGVSLFIAIATGLILEEFFKKLESKNLNIIDISISVIIVFTLYFYFIYTYNYDINTNKLILIAILLSGILLAIILKFNNNKYIVTLVLFALFCAHCFSLLPAERLFAKQRVILVDTAYLKKLESGNTDINKAIEYTQRNKLTLLNRVDLSPYNLDYPMNYLLSRKVNNLNLYSSFQNKVQQNFENKFEISPFDKNSGEVSGPSGRKNLYSLLNIDYVIRTKDTDKIVAPSTFKLVKNFGNVEVYKNNYIGDFIRPVDTLYSKSDFIDSDYKDIFIHDGAIIDEHYIRGVKKSPNKEPSIASDIILENLEKNGNRYKAIDKNKKTKLIVKMLNNNLKVDNEINISYFIKPTNKASDSKYKINGLKKRLVSEDILYSRGVYQNQIEIYPTAKKEIVFELDPNIEYDFKLFDIRLASNKYLMANSPQSNIQNRKITIDKNNLIIDFNNIDNKKFMVLPIFINRGLELKVNNQPRDIIDSNYGMVGFYLDKGQNEILLTYKQPYFKTLCLVSIISMLLIFYMDKKMNEKNTSS